MSISICTKAVILSKDGAEQICSATVSNIQNNTAFITFADEFLDNVETETQITFFDNVMGLATYECSLSAPKRHYKDGGYVQTLFCSLKKEVSTIQRRKDFKVEANVDLDMTPTESKPHLVPITHENERKDHPGYVHAVATNISAGGIYIKTNYVLLKEDIINVVFPAKDNKKLLLTAKVLRVDTYEKIEKTKTGKITIISYGYGCQFQNLSGATETALRNFVFQKDMEKRKKIKFYR